MRDKKILLIDDEKNILLMIKNRLRAHGFDVITASSGSEGLEKARKEAPDLIVLDVIMPNMDGFQACRKMKKSPELKDIPVIMLTSKDQKSDEFWGKKQGADVYLTKPCEDSILLKEITQRIGKG